MDTVMVEVTEDDIGIPGKWESVDGTQFCMLDKAIRRAMGTTFYTMFTSATEKDGRREIMLPSEAQKARSEWDRGRPVSPFKFTAPIVER
jgi:hypothetical protein